MKMKLILALTMLMMSVSMSAKGVDTKLDKQLRRDSAKIEYLNMDTNYTYPKWFMTTELNSDSVKVAKYYFTLGNKTYKVSRRDLDNAVTGKLAYGNYFIVRKKDGRKTEFFFKNYENL